MESEEGSAAVQIRIRDDESGGSKVSKPGRQFALIGHVHRYAHEILGRPQDAFLGKNLFPESSAESSAGGV